jgi:hypothetical protein
LKNNGSGEHRQPTGPIGRLQQIIEARRREGIETLFPVGSDKVPPEKWGPFSTRKPTDAEYAAWFRKYPYHNALIITGAINNLFVVDCDSTEAVEYFEKRGHPQTWTVRSHDNRLHFYFRHPGWRVRNNNNGRIFNHIDIKGDGGYVIAPGSVHKSGYVYSWLPDCSPGDVALASAPEWLLELLKPPPERPVETPQNFSGHISAYARAALQSELECAASAPEGQRNQALNDSAFALGQLVGGGELSADQVANALHQIANRWPNSSHSRATIDRALQAGMEAPRSGPRSKFNQDARTYAGNTAGPEPDRSEPPRPLRRPIPTATPFPVDALGEVLGKAACDIQRATQAAMAIAGQSVLGVAGLVVQPHWDLRIPTEEIKPTSLFLFTIVASGERKTASDNRATAEVRAWEVAETERWRSEIVDYEDELEAYEAARKQILNDKKSYPTQEDKRNALGRLEKPRPMPRIPMVLCPDATIEGLVRLLHEGLGYVGIFADEGGVFVGGHAMGPDAKIRTIGGLNSSWDGTSLKRARSTDKLRALHGRRVAMHLLVQPPVGDLFFGDPLLDGQGLLSRVLAAMPDELAGTRSPFNPADVQNLSSLSRFSRGVALLLRKTPIASDKDPRELRPSVLEMSPEAITAWIAFDNRVEKEKGPNGKYASIKRLANRAPEHAARLACVIDRFESVLVGKPADKLPANKMNAGVMLMEEFYLPEALRIYASIQDSPELALAEKTLEWARSLQDKVFSLPDVYQYGPYAVRDAEKARTIVDILLSHGHIFQIVGGATIRGIKRREAYRLVPNSQQPIILRKEGGPANPTNAANPQKGEDSTLADVAGLAASPQPAKRDDDGEVL